MVEETTLRALVAGLPWAESAEIVAAVNAIPALLDERDRLRAALRTLLDAPATSQPGKFRAWSAAIDAARAALGKED